MSRRGHGSYASSTNAALTRDWTTCSPMHLLDGYRHSAVFDTGNTISFHSYCGGFPLEADSFTYKFSWSPLGVLKALNSPARWIARGEELQHRYTLPGNRNLPG